MNLRARHGNTGHEDASTRSLVAVALVAAAVVHGPRLAAAADSTGATIRWTWHELQVGPGVSGLIGVGPVADYAFHHRSGLVVRTTAVVSVEPLTRQGWGVEIDGWAGLGLESNAHAEGIGGHALGSARIQRYDTDGLSHVSAGGVVDLTGWYRWNDRARLGLSLLNSVMKRVPVVDDRPAPPAFAEAEGRDTEGVFNTFEMLLRYDGWYGDHFGLAIEVGPALGFGMSDAVAVLVRARVLWTVRL